VMRMVRSVQTVHGLLEIAFTPILWWYGHAFKVEVVSHGLEVSAYDEQVNFVLVALFQVRDVLVGRIELAVAAAFNGDLQ